MATIKPKPITKNRLNQWVSKAVKDIMGMRSDITEEQAECIVHADLEGINYIGALYDFIDLTDLKNN